MSSLFGFGEAGEEVPARETKSEEMDAGLQVPAAGSPAVESLITSLLGRAAAGDKNAEHALWELIYDDLKKVARRALSHERPGAPIQATELVNALFLRLSASTPIQWKDRRHFFLVSAQVIRHILVDLARNCSRKKRGENVVPTGFEEWMAYVEENADQMLSINEALDALSRENPNGPRMQQVVTLRYFAGFREPEVAVLLGVHERTVKRDWQSAKNFLRAYFAK